MSQPERLRDDCLNALDAYVQEAKKSCELIACLETPTVSIEQLLAIVAQVELERDVKEQYRFLRQRLCETLVNVIEVAEMPGRTCPPNSDAVQLRLVETPE